jgi:hypothetical protein
VLQAGIGDPSVVANQLAQQYGFQVNGVAEYIGSFGATIPRDRLAAVIADTRVRGYQLNEGFSVYDLLGC